MYRSTWPGPGTNAALLLVAGLLARSRSSSLADGLALTPIAQFSNAEPRRDTNGQIIDAHDGNYQFANGTWWYFAMGYGLCNDTGTVNGCDPKCGYSPANVVNVWSSPDLSNNAWTKRAEVLPIADRPAHANCTFFRSHGAYSKFTAKWVVWVNAVNCPALHNGAGYLAATADHPSGPWEFAGVVKTKTTDARLGDMDIFVDDDGIGYAILTRCCGSAPTSDDRRMVVEKLSPDFLSGHAASETFGVKWSEAPALFKRNGIYYAFSAGCTCFGLGGAGVSVNYAKSPLGPWTTAATSIDPGCKNWSTCGAGHGCNPVTQAQQNAVITVPRAAGGAPVRYIWTGDRWQSGGNKTGAPAPGLKGWDYQTWLPLEWDDTVAPALPKPLQWVDSFPLQLPNSTTSSTKPDDTRTDAASRPPTEPRTLQGDTDWAAFLSRSDPINTFNISEPMTVPDIWLESAFLGNGMIGCQVLVCPGGICTQSLLLGTNTTLPSLDAPHQVVIPVARADVVDTRTGNASAACTEFHGKVSCFNLADQYARPRLGVGALILRQTSGTIVAGSIRTHLHNASISARIRTTQGDVEFSVFVHATRQLVVVHGLRGSGGERHTQLRFDFVPAPAVSPVQFEAKRAAGAFTRFTGSPLPGHYAPNPPASCSDSSCRQSLLVSKEGRGWVTSWRSGSGEQLLLTVTSDIPVRVGVAPKTTRASTEAASVLAAAAALGPSSLAAEHSSWWARLYWSGSSGAFVSLPAAAAKVEQFHWITLLKVASENACRRFVDSAFPPGILDNCLLLDGLNFVGPMQKTKYPFAIWDMNVEGAQWGSHSSNLPEQSLALARRIPEQLSNFVASVPRDMRNDSASIQVETASLSFLAECMVQHCDSDAFPLCVNNFSAVQDLPDEACLQHPGSSTPQNFYGGLPWVCHSIWLVYRHTMDEAILRDLLPLLKRSTNLYMRAAHVGADEKLHLPLMESPEYGEAADTSFDHALFRWCLQTLIRTSTLLPNSSTELEVQKWQNTLRKLSAPRIDPATGSLMIGANLSLHSSNKHFSHLFSIFPLGLQDWAVEAERELWTKSLAVFKHYNDPTVSDEGFTYLGMAIITAWARPALPGGAPAAWADSVLGNVSHFFRVPQLGAGTMYADHAACGPVAGCREGMAGPCNESPILASLALQQMLLQSWNGAPIGIFPAVSASWADARFARMRAEGAVLVTAVRANFTTIFFSLNATVGGNVSVHSTIVDLASSNAQVLVAASPGGEAGVFAISVSHSEPWAAVFYSKARGPPSSGELELALTPLPAGKVNLWGSRPAGSAPPIPPGPPPPGPLGPLPPCPASGCAHCGGCHWPYANNTLPDPKQPVLSSVVATTVACEEQCGSMAAPSCAGFTRKDAEHVCFFYSKSQVSGTFSHLRPDVSWHPNPHAGKRVD